MLDVAAYLDSFHNWEPRLDQAGVSSFSLERMDGLLKIFRHPESSLLFAHIAGSKGKGSTAAFLANILRASGYKVGLYTSPHLYSVNERIRVLDPFAGQRDIFTGSITDQSLAQLLSDKRPEIDRLRSEGRDITYYELMTALAVAHFAVSGVKVVVLETGLGGRLDATNIFDTSVCGITPIGMEHTAILGNTLPLIAAEKAAIIKADSQRAVFAPQAQEVLDVLMKRALMYGITPTLVDRDMSVDILEESLAGVVFNTSGRRAYHGLHSSLVGSHQAWNAVQAVAMAEDLETYGLVITEDSVRRGVADTRWPGRFEVVMGHPTVVIDSAHTVESAAACARAFAKVFPGRRAILLLAVSSDKDISGICRALMPLTAQVVVSLGSHARAFEFTLDNLSRFFPDTPTMMVTGVAAALSEAKCQAGSEGVVLAVGSIFLAAQVRALC